MKRFLYLTVCFFILGKFYGCNGDVFVDDFRSSDSELTLDGNGDVATIQFCSCQLGLDVCSLRFSPFNITYMMRTIA